MPCVRTLPHALSCRSPHHVPYSSSGVGLLKPGPWEGLATGGAPVAVGPGAQQEAGRAWDCRAALSLRSGPEEWVGLE